MEKKQVGALATAGVVAAVLLGGGLTVALASGGDPAPAGTEPLPTVSVSSSTAPPSSSTSSASVPSPVAPTAPVAPVQQPPAAPVDNQGMTEPEQPQPEPPPVDENGVIIRTPARDTVPPPPPPPNVDPTGGPTN